MEEHAAKPRLATVSLAGCFGCHMSLLDLDESLFELLQLVELDRTPLSDQRSFSGRCRLGLVEGGCATDEDVRRLRDFRASCDLLIAVGDCAINGGVPAMRNTLSLEECIREAYLESPSVINPDGTLPGDPALPRLLDRVYGCHEVVEMDHALPGCPPSAEAIWLTISALLRGQLAELPYHLLRYD